MRIESDEFRETGTRETTAILSQASDESLEGATTTGGVYLLNNQQERPTSLRDDDIV